MSTGTKTACPPASGHRVDLLWLAAGRGASGTTAAALPRGALVTDRQVMLICGAALGGCG